MYELRKIKDIGRVVTGKTPKTSIKEYWNGDVPFYTPSDMNGFKYLSKVERYISQMGSNSVQNALIPKNSILISCIGSDMGKVAINSAKGVTNQQINTIIPNTSLVDPQYLYYQLLPRKRELQLLASGGSAQPILNKSQFSEIKIALPSIATQKSIAQILGTLDDKIEFNQKTNQTLEDIAKAIFQCWFVDFDPVREKVEGRPTKLPDEINNFFPSEFVESELGEIPKDWEIKKISDFGKVICGKTPSTKVVENFNGEFPFITIPDMRSGITSLKTERTLTKLGANELTGKMLPEGSICVSCIATPGLVTITSTNSFTNQQINSIIPNNKNHKEFLFFSMLGLESVIKSNGGGGSVFTNLNTSKFKLLPIIKPSENLINKFSEISNSILEKIIINQRQSSILMTIKETLLPKLISGELQIPDAEKFIKEAGI
jgi:type I restriction enzyme S subunit